MTGHPDNRQALMRIRCAAKCCKRPKPGPAGLIRRPPAFEDFAPTLVRTFQPPSPRSWRVEVHPSVRFTSSSEHCDFRPAPGRTTPDLAARHRSTRSAFLGVSCPHRDVSRQRPHTHRDSRPRASVRPRRFARPRRFTPPPALRVCFAPLPRTGFALQGFVPRLEHDPLSRTAYPRAVARRVLRF